MLVCVRVKVINKDEAHIVLESLLMVILTTFASSFAVAMQTDTQPQKRDPWLYFSEEFARKLLFVLGIRKQLSGFGRNRTGFNPWRQHKRFSGWIFKLKTAQTERSSVAQSRPCRVPFNFVHPAVFGHSANGKLISLIRRFRLLFFLFPSVNFLLRLIWTMNNVNLKVRAEGLKVTKADNITFFFVTSFNNRGIFIKSVFNFQEKEFYWKNNLGMFINYDQR